MSDFDDCSRGVTNKAAVDPQAFHQAQDWVMRLSGVSYDAEHRLEIPVDEALRVARALLAVKKAHEEAVLENDKLRLQLQWAAQKGTRNSQSCVVPHPSSHAYRFAVQLGVAAGHIEELDARIVQLDALREKETEALSATLRREEEWAQKAAKLQTDRCLLRGAMHTISGGPHAENCESRLDGACEEDCDCGVMLAREALKQTEE